MPRFTAYRVKEYVVDVEAANLTTAMKLARDVPGARWRLLDDRLDAVAGVDGAKIKAGDAEESE